MKTLTILGFWCFLMTGSIYGQSKLIFQYDTAGNQIQYKYCKGSDCDLNKSAGETEIVKETSVDDEVLLDSFSLFPNPTQKDISVKWNSASKRQLEKVHLIDFSGKLLPANIKLMGDGAELHLDQLPAGVYFARFQFDDATIITKKILKN